MRHSHVLVLVAAHRVFRKGLSPIVVQVNRGTLVIISVSGDPWGVSPDGDLVQGIR
jgi:hypothetical protein